MFKEIEKFLLNKVGKDIQDYMEYSSVINMSIYKEMLYFFPLILISEI